MTGAIDTDDKAVLATYARARRKCGIGLARLKENGPKEYDAFLRVALFFASDGAQAHSFSPDALCAFLTTFLRGEGSWVKAEAPELLEALEHEGYVTQNKGSYHVTARLGLTLTLSEVLAFLENEANRMQRQKQQIRAMLQEKNRRINAKPIEPADEAFDEAMMREALKEAQVAYEEGEVPVGAVLTCGKTLIARDHNRVIATHDATAHAEMRVLKTSLDTFNSERLPSETTLYVTLEPCPMCAGALLLARVSRVVWGASDRQACAMGSRLMLQDAALLNWKARTTSGVLKGECEALLGEFFSRVREKKEDH